MLDMTYDDLIEHFGSAPVAAKRLGVSRQLLYYWKANGIPIGRQALIQITSRNRLICDKPEIVPNGQS
jgi:DNA-binding transcriptional regulator Cro